MWKFCTIWWWATMEKKILVFIAIFTVGSSNPLGQTVCESQNTPGLPRSATICESGLCPLISYLGGLGLGNLGSLGGLGLGTLGNLGNLGPVGSLGALGPLGSLGPYGSLGSLKNLGALGGVGSLGGLGSVGGLGSLGGLGALGNLGLGLSGIPLLSLNSILSQLQVPAQNGGTVCESTSVPNVPIGLPATITTVESLPNIMPFPGLTIPMPSTSTTVCESSPNIGQQTTTVCESTPNVPVTNMPILPMPGLPIMTMPLPMTPTATVCESNVVPITNMPLFPIPNMPLMTPTVVETSPSVPIQNLPLNFPLTGLSMANLPISNMLPLPLQGLPLTIQILQ